MKNKRGVGRLTPVSHLEVGGVCARMHIPKPGPRDSGSVRLCIPDVILTLGFLN